MQSIEEYKSKLTENQLINSELLYHILELINNISNKKIFLEKTFIKLKHFKETNPSIPGFIFLFPPSPKFSFPEISINKYKRKYILDFQMINFIDRNHLSRNNLIVRVNLFDFIDIFIKMRYKNRQESIPMIKILLNDLRFKCHPDSNNISKILETYLHKNRYLAQTRRDFYIIYQKVQNNLVFF